MTARPMTEGEREEQIARVIFSYGQHFFSDRDWAVVMAHRRFKERDRETPHPAPTKLDHAFAMAREINALLSTSSAVRGMREALEKIANMKPALSVFKVVDQFTEMRLLARQALDEPTVATPDPSGVLEMIKRMPGPIIDGPSGPTKFLAYDAVVEIIDAALSSAR